MVQKVCSGQQWRVPDAELGHKMAETFRTIAEEHGSSAVWLPQSGVVACRKGSLDQQETFPYDVWREEIFQAFFSKT